MKETGNFMTKLSEASGHAEADRKKISEALLRMSAKEYSKEVKEKMANDDFLKSIYQLAETSNSETITRNCLLIVGHIATMYDLYPNHAFDFLWNRSQEKKYLLPIARNIFRFPQFLKQSDFQDFILNLSKAAPKKDAIDMIYIITKNLKNHLDQNTLKKIKVTLSDFIEKNPNNYASKNEYPELIKSINSILPPHLKA